MLLKAVAVALLACAASCSRSLPSGSILDIINTKEVEKMLAQKRENSTRAEKRYLFENELDENFIPPIENVRLLEQDPRVDLGRFLRRNHNQTELLADLRGFGGRKVLKSSKNALFVTRKEYLQRDWCKTEPLIQKVKEGGCLTRTVINRFCYGQCNSFYIPKSPKRRQRDDDDEEEEDRNGPAFKACAFCRPSKFTWVTVTLRCPGMTPAFRKKRMQRIKQCKCVAANVD